MGSKDDFKSDFVPQHDYAIVDMKRQSDSMLFLVKNPWSFSALPGETQHMTSSGRSEPLSMLHPTPAFSTGLFWMELNQIFQNFESLYLNWNPGLFSWRQDAHFAWVVGGRQSPKGCFRTNPQYTIKTPDGGVVWIALFRHFVSKEMDQQTYALSSSDSVNDGFISLYIFQGDRRVYSSTEAIKNSHFVDSPNTLVKVDLPRNSSIIVSPSEQGSPLRKHHFTLSCYSLNRAELRIAPDAYPYKKMEKGAWSKMSAGGNSARRSYHRNPQYRIKLEETSDICFTLETLSNDLSVHVALLWAGGERVRSIAARDLVGDSGEYCQAFALARLNEVAAGSYTAVCSTFEEGQLGEYEQHVASSSSLSIEKIPALGAGYYEAHVAPALFRPDIACMKLPISTERFNRLLIRVWSNAKGSEGLYEAIVPLRVSVVAGSGDAMQVLGVSEIDEFSDSKNDGILLRNIDINSEMCFRSGVYLMLERSVVSGTHVEEAIKVTLQSAEPVRTGAWIET